MSFFFYKESKYKIIFMGRGGAGISEFFLL